MKDSKASEIPVVDMSDYRKRWPKIVSALKDALQTTGFVYLVNHGIAPETVQSAFESSVDFFSLPTDVKMRYKRDLEETFHGYTEPGLTVINPKSQTRLKELRESFDCNIYTGSDCPYPYKEAHSFQPSMDSLMCQCKQLSTVILKMLADALNLTDQDYFLQHHRSLLDETIPNYTSLRTLFYPKITEDISGAIRFDEHTDYGTFTLLFQDSIGGLEVKGSDGQWIAATPMPGSIVVNTGDLLNAWTGGLYRSTMHRVIVPENEYKKQMARQSIAFFVKPDNNTFVVPLVNSKDTEISPEFRNVTAGEHFRSRTMATRRAIAN